MIILVIHHRTTEKVSFRVDPTPRSWENNGHDTCRHKEKKGEAPPDNPFRTSHPLLFRVFARHSTAAVTSAQASQMRDHTDAVIPAGPPNKEEAISFSMLGGRLFLERPCGGASRGPILSLARVVPDYCS